MSDIERQASELRSAFTKYSVNLDTALGAGLTAACLLVEESAVQNQKPHIDTGLLNKSITHRVVETSSGYSGEVGSNVEYAAFHEFGTSKTGAYPFLTPALNSNKRAIEYVITNALKKVIR